MFLCCQLQTALIFCIFFFSWDSSIMMFNLILYLYIIYIDIYILFTNQQKKCASFALQKIPFSLPFLFPSF